MTIPSQNDFLLPFLNLLSDGQTLKRGQLMFRLAKGLDQLAAVLTMPVPTPKGESATYDVPDVRQWATWLNPPPADPSVAYKEQ